MMMSMLATLLASAFTPSILQTMALIFLSRITVPIPPRPACFRRICLRLLSQNVKLIIPISEFSAPAPAETIPIFLHSFSLLA